MDGLARAISREEDEFMRDAVIKKFEYCFELSWKISKLILKEKYGVEVFAPKECFRELRKNKLISDEDTEKMLQMTGDRNDIIHTYNESLSEEIDDKVRGGYFDLMSKLYDVLLTHYN